MLASAVSSSNRGRTLTLKGVDPETCMIVFKNHWTQVLRILEKHDPGRSGGPALSGVGGGLRFGPIPGDEASAVQNYVEHMLFLLMEEESGQGGAMGPILEFVVVENVMEKLFLWSLRREFTDDMKLEQLRMYEMLVAQAKQPLLHHKPILKPLMMLLSACSSSSAVGPSCTMGGPSAPSKGSSVIRPTCAMGPVHAGSSSSAVEAELVSLLHELCRVLVKEASVLELFFHSSQDQGAANFLLFSLLIPFIHRDGAVGTQARDALTLIMSLSSQNSLVAKHIAENTYFCPVLATGLSGLYSGLPAKLVVYSEGWFCLEKNDRLQVPALHQFLNSLHFCSTVCKVAHPSIRDQLLGYIYNGFLVPVLAPALHKLTLEEVMTTTAYLELFLRSISDPALLETFLIFILRHRHDNVNILDTLVSRINTPFQLGTVSLALFRTLIGLYCEDVMLQLILRYLIPCSHLVYGERNRLRKRDCYSITASALLSLTPSFFISKSSSSPTHPPKPDYILWSKVTEGLLRGNMGMEDLFSGGDSVGCSRITASEPLMHKNYLQYLYDARRAICTSVQACCVWSAPYDGLNPSPEEYQEEDEEKDDDECLALSTPPTQTPTPHPPSETSSTGDRERVGTLFELEWDDTYDATPDGDNGQVISENSQVPDRMIPDEPPKHIQEMRKSAIMLIKGSYIEESDFQDDVLVYNLIAQKDARDDHRKSIKNTLNHSHTNGLHKQTNNNHIHNSTEHQTNNYHSHNNSQNHMHNNHNQANNIHDAHKSKLLESIHEGVHPRSEKSTLIINGHSSEEQKPDTEAYAAHLDHNRNVTVEEHQNEVTSAPAKCDDFISQCLELIHSLGGEEENFMEDEDQIQRLQALLHGEEKEVDFSSFCDDDDEDDGDEELSKTISRKHGFPFTGPFISVLLSRLENMLENSIEVNLLVTGILAQLATYPQPLLQGFLLNTKPVFQPSIRSLYQVLVSVGCQIEQYAASRPDFPELVREAAQYLLLKDQILKEQEQDDHLQDKGSGWFLNGHIPCRLRKPLPPCPKILPHQQNKVFAIILFAEFLKELAAIAQEHSILPDLTTDE
ncbi:FHF complex subunit HOOK interacting protein 1A [Myxocyprinus asiaticus]|uniref:FHF complex subunit HOOK interacting protein 1A n=1 Tax=Myxocyprinus asiaticus TaxID=70543 RepID=UPI0022213D15|nr:FHF complex subunit HOOK interacting protein 1A [Myxocyprinus asiaticus]XP_051515093.1 FHF complex subunit HOOK interacting protein 1A [Myxocyprinus asiaticus]XP_051515094.1 FHF complex subunit HOOK interacting protein 1A [Myxocyprinus asiaticus]